MKITWFRQQILDVLGECGIETHEVVERAFGRGEGRKYSGMVEATTKALIYLESVGLVGSYYTGSGRYVWTHWIKLTKPNKARTRQWGFCALSGIFSA
jgi:hypothetical protein